MNDVARSYGVIAYKLVGDDVWYLLVKHHAGHWGIAKGHAEEGESPRETAVRELLEETGVVATITRDHEFIEDYDATHDRVKRNKIVTYFLARITNEPELNAQPEEIEELRWMSYEHALRLATYEGTREVLRQAQVVILQHL